MKIRLFITAWILFSLPLLGEETQDPSLKKSTIRSTKYFDINRIKSSIRNDGIFASQSITGNTDFFFDGKELIYVSGLWLAAKVNGEIRASAADFRTDWVGGAIDVQGNSFGKGDSTFRVYKISRGDNASNNPDYAEWPIELGAPSDAQGNPLLIGDQTLWCCFTDSYLENREYNICPPLGAEVHLTVWGWEAIDNVVYVRWKIINKSNTMWEDTYWGVYSDPDVLDANDDLTASDSTLKLVYCYDAKDQWINRPYHAVGYQMLESPVIVSPGDTALTFWGAKPGFRNLPIYSPRMEKSLGGSFWNDIPYNEKAAPYIYNRLQCLDFNGNPAIDPFTQLPTKWAFSGDPSTGSGWIDTIMPRDRRMMLSTGPLHIAPGDSATMMVAIVPVSHHKRIDNIIDIKKNARAVQSAFHKSASLYSEVNYASPGQRGRLLPVRLFNTTSIQSLKFYFIASSDAAMVLRDVYVAERAVGFHIKFSISTREALIELESINAENIAPGNGAVVYLKIDISDSITANHIPFKISAAECVDQNGKIIRLDSTTGSIQIESFPTPPQLLTPVNGQYIDGMKIQFSWSKTVDQDSTFYFLQLPDYDGYYSEASYDTSIILPVSKFLFYRHPIKNTVRWFTTIMDYSQAISSPDTFQFQIPSVEKLTFVKSLYNCNLVESFPALQNIQQASFDLPYAYVIQEIKSDSYPYRSYQLVVIHLGDNDCHIINSQTVPFYYEDQFSVQGDRAFSCDRYSLRTFSVSDSQRFVFQKTFSLNFTPDMFLVYGDYIFFLAGQSIPPKIAIHKIHSLTNVAKVVEINLSDWVKEEKPVCREASMRIKNNFLFLAFGDWGIFDISNPELPQLLVRVETPDLASAIDYEDGQVFVGNNKSWLGVFDVISINTPRLIHSEITDGRYRPKGYGGEEWTEHLFVLDGFVYLSLYGNLLVCHYEPGKYFILDGILESAQAYITSDRIFSVLKSRKTIDVYENRIVTNLSYQTVSHFSDFNLKQNYPNPFNHSTQIRFSLNKSGRAQLNIFNLQGQLVKNLIDEVRKSGAYQVLWDGTNQSNQPLCSGLYFYQLKTDNQVITKKMLLLK